MLKDATKEAGIEFGDADLVVGKRQEMVRVGEDQKAVIEQLISNNYGADFWAALSSLRPDLTAQLADAELLRRRENAVAEFERELAAKRWAEPDWERFGDSLFIGSAIVSTAHPTYYLALSISAANSVQVF